MADYPTFSQKSKAERYTKPVSEVGGRLRSPATDVKNDCRDQVLDLSGKPGGSSVARVAGRQWTSEQDAALDLSSHGKPTSGQAEALDLSKRSTPPARLNISQSHPVSVGILQSEQPLPSRKLLEKALTSGLSSSDFQLGPLTSIHQPGRKSSDLLDLGRAENLRRGYEGPGIRPFSSSGYKPLGLSMPQVTLPNAGSRLVHTQKPIAITTPQPHHSSVNTSQQSETSTTSSSNRIFSDNHPRSIHSTVASQSFHQESNQPRFGIQNLPFSSSGYILSRPESRHSLPTSFSAAIDNAVERFVIRAPQGDSNFQSTSGTVNQIDTQLGFTCSKCPKVFKSKAAMKLHMTVHKTLDERQFVCQICQRRFLHRHHLVVHQRKHSGEKPYMCNACGKSFMAVFLLHKHLRKHLREQGQSTQISNDQLKQLHGRKRSVSKSEGGDDGNVGDDVNDKRDLVIVSDDEDATVSVGPNAEDGRRSEEQNIICLDDISRIDSAQNSTRTDICKSSETVTDHVSKPAIKTEETNNVNTNVEIRNIEIILASSVKEKDGKGVKTKLVIKEIEYDTNFKTDLSNDSSDSKGKMTLNKSDHSYHNTVNETKSNINETKSKTSPETLINKEESLNGVLARANSLHDSVKQSTDIDPWPKYTSEDEVELDFATGELKILNKPVTSPNRSEVIEMNDSEKTPPDFKVEKQVSDIEKEPDNEPPSVSLDREMSYQVKHNQSIIEFKEEVKSEKRSVNDLENEVSEESRLKKLKMDEVEAQERTCSIGLDSDAQKIALKTSETEIGLPQHKHRVKKYWGRKKIKRFKCETCYRTFYSQHHLLLHMNTHKKNLALDSLRKAKANQINIAIAQKMGFSCTACKKHFKMQKGLNSHMRIHSSKLAENKLIRRRFRDFLMTDASNKPSKTKNLKPPGCAESQKIGHSETETLTDNGVVYNLEIGSSNANYYEQNPLSSNSALDVNDSGKKKDIQVMVGGDRIRRYVCHACNNAYTTKQKLKMHALIHKDNCYLCDMCGKSFFREATLEKHISTHMLPRPHVCSVCKKSFIHRSSLMRHKSIHEKPSGTSVKQQTQDVKFELEMKDTYEMLRKERLEKLQKEKMGELKIEASSANLEVIDLSAPCRNELTPNRLDENLQPPKLSPMITTVSISKASVINLSPPNITKESCQSGQTDAKRLKIETQIPEITDENDENRPRSTRSVYRNKHETEHISEEEPRIRQKRRKTRVYPTSCRICREVFPNVIGLKTHMAVHNSVETHLYECSVCGHRFTQSCSLLRHLKTSCGDGIPKDTKLQCNTCEKVFQRRNAYDRHMDSHINGEPPKLSTYVYEKGSDDSEPKSMFETNVRADLSPLSHTQEAKAEVDNENVHTENVDQQNDFVDDAEISEAETIPYGKTSSDESNNESSDCSDTESDQEEMKSQPQQPNNSSLNLLSEVCSSLITFEKEAEIKKQNELISVQKELETIDILARLSRQNALQGVKSESDTFSSEAVGQSHFTSSVKVHDYSSKQNLMSNILIPKQEPVEFENTKIKAECKEEETKDTVIPTVVTDIESEAEKRRKSYFIRMQQRILEGTQRSQSILTSPIQTSAQQMPTLRQNSLLAAALFDKGKPDPISPYKPSVVPFSSAITADMMPTDLSMKNKTVQSTPHSLSPSSSPKLGNTLTMASATVPQPPPLVPVFKCPNCGKLLYNKSDYRSHMRGHGISPPDSPPQFAQIQQPGPSLLLSETSFGKETPSDTTEHEKDTLRVTDSLPSHISNWHSPFVKREPGYLNPSPFSRAMPPSTLNLSLKKPGMSPLAIPSTSKSTPSQSVVSTPDLDSPMCSSDTSDVTMSPVGSVALNADILRQELRNKIYARRKSQGLEELTVEFKTPEKTEMTEEEQEKLQHRRESNRQAAQRSRMRKRDRIISLLDELHQEESVQKSIRQQMEIMENEKKALLSILENHECVKDKHS